MPCSRVYFMNIIPYYIHKDCVLAFQNYHIFLWTCIVILHNIYVTPNFLRNLLKEGIHSKSTGHKFLCSRFKGKVVLIFTHYFRWCEEVTFCRKIHMKNSQCHFSRIVVILPLSLLIWIVDDVWSSFPGPWNQEWSRARSSEKKIEIYL